MVVAGVAIVTAAAIVTVAAVSSKARTPRVVVAVSEAATVMALAVAGPRARATMAPEVLMEVMVRRAVEAEQAKQVEAPPPLGRRCGERSCARLRR